MYLRHRKWHGGCRTRPRTSPRSSRGQFPMKAMGSDNNREKMQTTYGIIDELEIVYSRLLCPHVRLPCRRHVRCYAAILHLLQPLSPSFLLIGFHHLEAKSLAPVHSLGKNTTLHTLSLEGGNWMAASMQPTAEQLRPFDVLPGHHSAGDGGRHWVPLRLVFFFVAHAAAPPVPSAVQLLDASCTPEEPRDSVLAKDHHAVRTSLLRLAQRTLRITARIG